MSGKKVRLSRRACQACFLSTYGSNGGWRPRDDYLWDEKGIVQCPLCNFAWHIVTKPPPADCPYLVEAMLDTQEP